MKRQYESEQFLTKISVAARTLLNHPLTHEWKTNLSFGLSIRTRARVVLALLFLVTIPVFFIGVLRSEKVAQHAQVQSEYENFWRRVLEAKIAIKDLDIALWEYVVEREFENGQAALSASMAMKQAIGQLIIEKPVLVSVGPTDFLPGLALRIDAAIKRAIENYTSVSQIRLNVMSLLKEIKSVEKQIAILANKERQTTLKGLIRTSRDELLLLLILICSIPIFIGFLPIWLFRPLSRLRQLAGSMETMQFKDVKISGNDEIALVAKSVRNALKNEEETRNKMSSKIFELRNVLRSTIGRVEESVFIVDRNLKINYTNDAAANLVAIPQHQIEGTILTESIYCPVIRKALERAFVGDVEDECILVTLELSDGRSLTMNAYIGMVRNRDGEVSRAVLVLKKADNV